MQTDRPASRTALGTLAQRAAHQLLDAPPLILADPVAVALLGPLGAQRIRAAAAQYQTPAARALRAHVILRSRYAEDRLAAAVGRGVTQYLILGAGFDSFALRQPAWAQALRIIEVDHPGTQATKRKRLTAAGLTIPPNTTFASVDFEHETLEEGLRRAQVALDRPTFCAWLGVTMYLTPEAIAAVLRTVATFPTGSEIVLTFITPREAPSPLEQRVADLGEPWLSAFAPEAMEALLRDTSFTRVELLTSAAAAAYFQHRLDDLPAPTNPGIAAAVR